MMMRLQHCPSKPPSLRSCHVLKLWDRHSLDRRQQTTTAQLGGRCWYLTERLFILAKRLCWGYFLNVILDLNVTVPTYICVRCVRRDIKQASSWNARRGYAKLKAAPDQASLMESRVTRTHWPFQPASMSLRALTYVSSGWQDDT